MGLASVLGVNCGTGVSRQHNSSNRMEMHVLNVVQNFTLPTGRIDNIVSELHFGSSFEARGLTLEAGGSVASVIENVGMQYLRYPGGTHRNVISTHPTRTTPTPSLLTPER